MSERSVGELHARLAEMERRWKWVRFARAGGLALVFLLAVLASGAATDYALALSPWHRLLLTFVCWSAVAAFVWFEWLRPFLRPLRPSALAWMLEKAVPDFHEKLISSIEFSGRNNGRVSIEMIERVLAETEADLRKVNPRGVFPLKRRYALAPLAVFLAFAVVLVLPSLKFRHLVKRVAFPSPSDATVGRFDLQIAAPSFGNGVEGDSIEFAVRCTDSTVRSVELCVKDMHVKRFLMTRDPESGIFRHTVEDVRRSFDVWAQSGNVSSAKRTLEITRRPDAELFSIHYVFPQYTGLPESTVLASVGDMKAYSGTVVNVAVTATKMLKRLAIDWMGATRRLPLDTDARTGRTSLLLETGGIYRIALTDTDGLVNLKDLVFPVQVLRDKPPAVRLVQPASDSFADPEDMLELTWSASDDFGIVKHELRYAVNGIRKKNVEFDAAVTNYVCILEQEGVRQGDEIEFRVCSHDAAGNRGSSEKRFVVLAKGRNMRQATRFSAEAERLRERLSVFDDRMNNVRSLRAEIRGARTGKDDALIENLAHNLNMMRRQSLWARFELKGAELGASSMQNTGFFPRSRACCDLLARYFNQERLFSGPALNVEGLADEAVNSLSGMAALAAEMTGALIFKAGEQLPLMQAQQLVSAAAVGTAEGAAASARVNGIRKRAEAIASAAESVMAGDFASSESQTVQGITGSFYPGVEEYVMGSRVASTKPSLTRNCKSLVLPDAGSFGVNTNTFSARFSGLLSCSAAATCTFLVTSKDASRLYVDGRLAVRNDGRHASRQESGQIALEPGLHTVHLLYTCWNGDPSLAVQWQTPAGIANLEGDALFSSHVDGLPSRLRLLEKELAAPASDFRTLDRLAESIRARLRPMDDSLRELARQIYLYERPDAWNVVASVADDLRDQAYDAPEPAIRDDSDLMADALEKAAEERSLPGIRRIADKAPDLFAPHELDAARRKLERASADAGAAVAAFTNAIGRAGDQAPDETDLRRIAESIEAARELPVAGIPLARNRRMRSVSDSLSRAGENARAAEQAWKTRNPDETIQKLAAVTNDLREAADRAAAAVAESGPARENARRAMEELAGSSSERLGNAERMLSSLPEQIAAVRPDDARAAREIDRGFEDISNRIDNVSARLRNSARMEIEKKDGDIGQARDKLAMAKALDRINRDKIEAARKAVSSALATPIEPPEDRRERFANLNGREIRARRMAEAEKDLRAAGKEVAEARDLMDRANAMHKREVPGAEQQAIARQLDALAKETLPDDVLRPLESLNRLRAVSDEVTKLASASKELERGRNERLARELAASAEQAKSELAAILDKDGREAFVAHADDILSDARRETRDMLSSARHIRERNRLPASGENPAALAAQAANKLERLEEQAARADAVWELLSDRKGDALRRFQENVKPPLEAALRKTAAGENAEEQMAEAIEETKEFARSLDDYDKDIAMARDAFFRESRPAAPREPAAPTSDPLFSRMDRMKNMMLEEESSQAAADAERESITEDVRNALHLLDRIPEGALSASEEERVADARRNIESQRFDSKASEMGAVAATVEKTDPELKAEMENIAAKLRADQSRSDNADALERRAGELRNAVISEADALVREMAATPDPSFESARRIVQELRGNLKAGNVQGARRNMDALDEEIAAATKPARWAPASFGPPERGPDPHRGLSPPESTEELERTAPELAVARNPGMDWNARRALTEMAARATVEPDLLPKVRRAARAAQIGDFERSARYADGAAALQFQRAAADTKAAKSRADDVPAVFRQPRRELAEAEEGRMRAIARENRAALAGEAEKELAAAVGEAAKLLQELAAARPDAAAVGEAAAKTELAVDRVEAARAALGAADHEAHRAMEEALKPAVKALAEGKASDGKQAAEAAETVGKALEEYAGEIALGKRRAEEWKKTDEQVKDLETAVAEADAARERLDRAAAPHAEALFSPRKMNVHSLPEEDRKSVERLAKGYDYLDPVKKAERMQQMAEAIKSPDSAQKQVLSERAAEVLEDAKVKAANEELSARKNAVEQKAAELAKTMEQRGTIGAERTKDALDKVVAAVKTEPNTDKTAAQNAVNAVKEAAAALKPGPDPQVPLTEEAFDAASKAAALGNRDAINKALKGDYAGAKESMDDLATRMPDSAKRDLAGRAAKEFATAEDMRMAEMPQPLADAVRSAEQAAGRLPPAAADQLKKAADAAKAGDLARASEHSRNAANASPGDTHAPLQELAKQIQNAADEKERRLAQLPAEARQAIEVAKGLARETDDPVAHASLKRAEESIENGNMGEAAHRMMQAAMAMRQPQPKAKALQSAGRLAEAAGRPQSPPRERTAPQETQPAVAKSPAVPPELRQAAAPDADWNVRRGLMEAAHAAMRSPYAAEMAREAARAAARGDLRRAAETAPGRVADQFRKAAENREAANEDGPSFPRSLTAQEQPPSKAAEKKLLDQAGREADRHRELEKALAALMRADEKCDNARSELAKAALPHEKALATPKEMNIEVLPTEDKDAIARLLENYDRADPAEKARRMAEMAEAIKSPESAQKRILREKADGILNDPDFKRAAEADAARRAELDKKADSLAAELAARQTIPAEAAAGALQALRAALAPEAANPAAVDKELDTVQKAIAAMKPAPPPVVALNDEAFDAAARARALNNADAVEKALHGDFDGAGDGMRRLAEASAPGARRALAEDSARKFAEAKQAQMEQLPKALADAVNRVEPVFAALPPYFSEEAKRAADAARAGDFARASEHLARALPGAQKEQQPALRELAGQLRAAAAAEAAKTAAMPPEARNALNSIRSLSREADPVTQAALKKARDDIMRGDYADAAGRMAAASLTMPEERRRADAIAAAKSLGGSDRAQYGKMPPALRDAAPQLEDKLPEAVAAAKRGDFAGAAEEAAAANDPAAMELFRKAADNQLKALPPEAREGIEIAARTAPHAEPQIADALKEAERAARMGELAAAETAAARAARSRDMENEIYRRLEEAREYRDKNIAPLQKALEEAAQNRFGKAARYAAESPRGQDVARALSRAEEAINKAARAAMDTAYRLPNSNERNQLADAGQRALADDLAGARQSAGNAGEAGRPAVAALEGAENAAADAAAMLKQAMEDAKAGNVPASAAENMLDNAIGDLERESARAQARQSAAQQEADDYSQAAKALSRNRLSEAAGRIGRTGTGVELADRIRGIQNDAACAADNAERQAASAADRQAAERLAEAARLARGGDLDNALQNARAAGGPGRETAAAMEQASSARDVAVQAANQAAGRAAQAAQQAAGEAANARTRRSALQQARDHLARGDIPQAMNSTKQAAQGGYEAAQAAGRFAQAAKAASPQSQQTGQQASQQSRQQAGQQSGQQSGRPGGGQGNKSGSGQSQQESLARALARLQVGQSELASGNPRPAAARNIEQAARELDRALLDMARTVLARTQPMRSASGDSGEESQSSRFSPGSAGMPGSPGSTSPGSGGGGGRTGMHKDVPELPADSRSDLGDTWAGAGGTLKSDDKQREKMLYNDYYRKASERYLEAIQKAAKERERDKWALPDSTDETESVGALQEEGN